MIDVGKIAEIGAIVCLGAWQGFREYREYRGRKKFNLAVNPKRCEDHEVRLRGVENILTGFRADIENIKVSVHDISERINRYR